MATAWKISTSASGVAKGGPEWSSTTKWNEATDADLYLWEYIQDWTFSATAVSQFGGIWSEKTPTWANTTEKWTIFTWNDVTQTKGSLGTETIV
tara:strand:- start:276 stop:557 length:282 start_codon:yes stop_codon:yes gene_type:complete